MTNWKKYISTQQVYIKIYIEKIKYLSTSIPIHIIPNILNEEDIDIVIEEIVINEHFQKSNTERETYESLEELKYPREYDDDGCII